MNSIAKIFTYIITFKWLIDLFKVNDDFEKGKNSDFVKFESPNKNLDISSKNQLMHRWQTAGMLKDAYPGNATIEPIGDTPYYSFKKIATTREFLHDGLNVKYAVMPGDLLELDYSNGHKITYNLISENFYIDDNLTVMKLPDVMGITKAGISRIDGYPIIKVKLKHEEPLILKANLRNKQFEFIARLEDFVKIQDGDGFFKI